MLYNYYTYPQYIVNDNWTTTVYRYTLGTEYISHSLCRFYQITYYITMFARNIKDVNVSTNQYPVNEFGVVSSLWSTIWWNRKNCVCVSSLLVKLQHIKENGSNEIRLSSFGIALAVHFVFFFSVNIVVQFVRKKFNNTDSFEQKTIIWLKIAWNLRFWNISLEPPPHPPIWMKLFTRNLCIDFIKISLARKRLFSFKLNPYTVKVGAIIFFFWRDVTNNLPTKMSKFVDYTKFKKQKNKKSSTFSEIADSVLKVCQLSTNRRTKEKGSSTFSEIVDWILKVF